MQVTSADGTPIAVWSSGAGPSLVLVHGTTADHSRWARVTPLLEPHFSVYAMDRRGRGGSGDGTSYSMAREAADVVAVAEAVERPLTLVGHSYGAICCLEAALLLTTIDSLVLYEPPLPIAAPIVPAEVRDELDRLLEQGEREAALVTFFRSVVRAPESQIDVLRASPAWPARVAAAHTISREIRLESQYRPDLDRLRALRVPTLLLLGGDSPQFFREATRQLNDALPGSRVHEIPGQQHVAMDMVPEEFARLVTVFAKGARAGVA